MHIKDFGINMISWKCQKCKKYKPINYKKLKEGDCVFFYKEKIKARKIEKIIYTGKIAVLNHDVGMGVGIDAGVVVIEASGHLYECALVNVYPYWAPAKITYSIFGKCEC